MRDAHVMRRSALVRFVAGKPRLVIALALGVVAAWLLPGALAPVTRLLLGWNAAVWSYVALMGWLMARANVERVRGHAEREDPSAAVVLALMSVAAIASLAAIVIELASVKDLPSATRVFHYAITAATLVGSWLALNMMFTIHYAHLYYRSPSAARALRFPEGDGAAPNYWDFLYFAFTIAVAAATSDVSVTSRAMRKAVLAQSLLSFLFNAAIIGMSINVAAGLVGA